MTRIALVGCGAIAECHHLPNIAASADLKLQTACDVDLERARRIADTWGARRWTSDWRDVFADDVDMILLCTHTGLRRELILPALEHGIPVYTEKPLAEDAGEALEICRHVKRTGVPVGVGYNRRSCPAADTLRAMVATARREGAQVGSYFRRDDDARVPMPEEAQTQVLIRVNDDARTWKSWLHTDSGGALYDCTGHMLDVALTLVDSTPVEAYAAGSRHGNFTEILTFEDGSMVTLQYTVCGNFSWPKELYEVSLRNVFVMCDNFVEIQQVGLRDFAERIGFPLDYGADLTDRDGIAGYKEAVARFSAPDFDRAAAPYPYIWPDKGHRDHLARFAAHTRGEGPNPFPAADACRLNIILDALVESLRQHRPVPIDADRLAAISQPAAATTR